MIARQTLSQAAYAICAGAGVSSVLRWFNQHKLLILMYHQIHKGEVDPVENFDGLSVELDDFVRQMRYLARNYQVVPLERCLDPSPTPVHRAAIAFDDAYASFYHLAYPVLRALGLPATVFVPTDFIEGRTPMWWDRLRHLVSRTKERTLTASYRGQRQVFPVGSQAAKQQALRTLITELRFLPVEARDAALASLQEELMLGELAMGERHAPLSLPHMREMADHGMTFSSHSQTHRSFPTLSPEELRREICESKVILERWLERPVTWLSYPFGDFDERALAILPTVGYDGAVTTIDGLNHGERRFELRRIAVGGQTTFPQFMGATSGVREATWWLRRCFSSVEEVRRADPVY
jgi:peptidoglycan/xylan/chitin deacetylase (PgdA/CDA1 family)